MVVDRVSLLVSFSCDRSSHDVLGRCIYDATCKNHESVCVRACVCVCGCVIRSEMKTILCWAIKNKRANAMGEKG